MPRRRRYAKKIILGITGGYACGKTSVARMFVPPGARLIDADAIAHKVIRPGSKVYRAILKAFGSRVLGRGTSVDRAKLAGLVFKDRRLLNRLNRIIHPEIISTIKKKMKSAPRGLIVLDAPLLIEKGLDKAVDKVVVVKAETSQQIARAARKRNLNSQEIRRRIDAQIPLSGKLRIADFIIDNSGSIGKTRKQVAAIRRLLWKS